MKKYLALTVLLSLGLFLAQVRIPGPGGQLPSGGGGTWTTNTKTCANQGGGSGGVTCTWSASVTSGQSQFCYVNSFATSITFAVADSNSDSFVAIGSPVVLNTATYQLFWFAKATTSITTVTLTPTPGGNFPSILCNSATDSGASPAFDAGPCNGSASTNPLPCTTPSSGLLTLAAQDYAMEGCETTGDVIAAGTGWTQGSLDSDYITSGYGLFTTSVTPACANSGLVPASILAGAWKP